jgi:LysM repeat protein
MFSEDKSLSIIRKGFIFPLSIKSVKVSEDAKVATYEYAWTNGAEHERVKWYVKISVNGVFTAGSGSKKPEYYVEKLKLTNNNKPGTFIHPTLGTYKCIMKNLEIELSGEELEVIWRNSIGNTYTFSFELREHTDPNTAKKLSKIDKLFPAPNVKPPTDNYSVSLAYNTCTQLYNAIIEKKIMPGTDPIKHKEWLAHPYDLRKCAYDRRVANPTGEAKTSVSNANSKTYTVKPWDTWISIANKLWISFTSLFEANKGRSVRQTDKSDQGKQWKSTNKIYPWDILLVP